jgi:hypothetical protein
MAFPCRMPVPLRRQRGQVAVEANCVYCGLCSLYVILALIESKRPVGRLQARSSHESQSLTYMGKTCIKVCSQHQN